MTAHYATGAETPDATSYERYIQRELIDMAGKIGALAQKNADLAQKRVSEMHRLRANIEALGGYAGNERDRGYNEAVIDAVALIDRALAGEEP